MDENLIEMHAELAFLKKISKCGMETVLNSLWTADCFTGAKISANQGRAAQEETDSAAAGS